MSTLANVYLWPEGHVTSYDQFNQEMLEFSGPIKRGGILTRISRAATAATIFHRGPQWHPIISKEEACAH